MTMLSKNGGITNLLPKGSWQAKMTVKHGRGSLMYWGVFWSLGTGPLVLIKGTINHHRYIKILEEHSLPFIAKNNLINFKFVQDNVPCHFAKSVKTW